MSTWNGLKRTPLKPRKTPIKRSQKKIAYYSKSRHKLDARQKEAKAIREYKAEHPYCEYPMSVDPVVWERIGNGAPATCSDPVDDVHHSRGKVGSLRWDKRYFKSACREHHTLAHHNVAEAVRVGFSSTKRKPD